MQTKTAPIFMIILYLFLMVTLVYSYYKDDTRKSELEIKAEDLKALQEKHDKLKNDYNKLLHNYKKSFNNNKEIITITPEQIHKIIDLKYGI